MTSREKQNCRRNIIKRLKEIKTEAYSGVTCMEYDAIKTLVYFMELIYSREAVLLGEEEVKR